MSCIISHKHRDEEGYKSPEAEQLATAGTTLKTPSDSVLNESQPQNQNYPTYTRTISLTSHTS